MSDEQNTDSSADERRLPTDPVDRERLGVRLLLGGILISVVVTIIAVLGGPSITVGYWLGIVVGFVGLTIAGVYGLLDLGRGYGLGLAMTVVGLLVIGYGYEREILPVLFFGAVVALVGVGVGSYRIRT